MKVQLGPGTTLKDADGTVRGGPGEIVEVDQPTGEALLAGGSAVPVESPAPADRPLGRRKEK